MGKMPWCGLLLLLAVGPESFASSLTVREAGVGQVAVSTSVVARAGETVFLEVVLDSGGQTIEGFAYDLTISPATARVIRVDHAQLESLTESLLGPPVIDDQSGMILNLTQGSLDESHPAGVVVVATVELLVGEVPASGIVVSPALGDGDTLGLGGGVDAPDLYSVRLVPEPGATLMGVSAIAALAAARRSHKRRSLDYRSPVSTSAGRS